MLRRTKAAATTVAGSVIRGLSRDKAWRLARNIDESSDNLKTKTGKRIEDLAREIRHLGRDVRSRGEAESLARRLEKTADYLRFRPTSSMGHDVVRVIRRRPVYLAAGASVVAGVLAYRYLRRS